MPTYRFQMSLVPSDSLARNRVMQTFFLDQDGDPWLPANAEALADDALALWRTNSDFLTPFPTIECRVYNVADAQPREPLTIRTTTYTSTPAAPGPREVALCLSYYADRNLPTRRGRMYFGPFTKGQMDERPSETLRDRLGAIAAGISGLGGINVQWVQHSRKLGHFENVSHWWVDDEWDTQRRRGLRATTRARGTVSG